MRKGAYYQNEKYPFDHRDVHMCESIRVIDFARSICSKFGADAEVVAIFVSAEALASIWYLRLITLYRGLRIIITE